MPKIVLSMDGLVLKEIALDKQRITIGRKPHNDIQIDNLAISGEHASIATILQDAFLEDLNSTNGTYVNGQPVKKHALKDGDVVELGKYRLKFLKDTPPPAALANSLEMAYEVPQDFTKTQNTTMRTAAETMVTGFAEGQTATQGVTASGGLSGTNWSQPESDAVSQIGVVQILSGRNAGRELELSKSLTTLGKPGLQVAVITRRSVGYFITHVEGTAFPVVNGREIDAQARALQDHDVIELAGVKMEFYLRAG
ncbi:FHA domain-containing protein [Niveibacterium sp. 24ML]|uniref:FHA domain-containing protein n=1 Tax=Niveibacterium sp. 24ML TaxID=2985512 RepID=UPI00226D5ECD|nr:FHA domain-containing protein [Niveibacterium sp. 24ML]MCX9154882.1 FHA domain-containing protein [Niveibacterium sp. 24ML]